MDKNVSVVAIWLLFVIVFLPLAPKFLKLFIRSKTLVFWWTFISHVIFAFSAFFVCWISPIRKIQLIFFLIGIVFLFLCSEIFLEKKFFKSKERLIE